MTTYIAILGHGIRANLHISAGDPLAPVVGMVRDSGLMAYGLSAARDGPADVLYAARPEEQALCGAEVSIKTVAEVDLFHQVIQPPVGTMPHVHTNTHNSKHNRRILREGGGATMAFKPVLAARPSKSGKAQLCARITTRGPSQIIYAAPHSGITPMPCGAFVWLVCPAGVEIVPASGVDHAEALMDAGTESTARSPLAGTTSN